jgi:hypothetical protein
MNSVTSKKQRLLGLACTAGLAFALAATGCKPGQGGDAKLNVGTVDTAVLLRDDPSYQTLSIDYMKENTDLRASFMDRGKGIPNGNGQQKRALQMEYIAAQKKLDAKWMEKTQKFLESRHGEIRDTAQKIAESKDIDMVIVNSKEYPTTEFGGVDITKDLSLALTQESGAPAGTASPGKQGG